MAPEPVQKWGSPNMSNGLGLSGIPVYQLLIGGIVCVLAISVTYNKTVLYLRRRTFKKENGCEPMLSKVSHKDPFGLVAMLNAAKAKSEHKMLENILQRNRELGNTFSSFFFNRSVIITAEPENIKTILSLRFNDFGIGTRQDTLGALLGKGIFTTDGQLWAHSRAMIRPNFTRDQVADLAAFERHIQELFRVIPRDGSTVDLQELFFSFTIDSATEFLFGRSTDTLRSRRTNEGAHEARFAVAFNKAQDYCANRDRWAIFRHIMHDSAGEEAIRTCHEFVDQYVNEAIQYRNDIEKRGAVKEEKYVFLHELAKSTTDKIRLRDELLNILLAGRDTTASLLSNMWFMLAKNPNIYQKLRKEIEETLHGELPTYEQLRNLKYLKYCMNESLRTHPVVPMNGRFAVRDTLLPLGGGPDGKSPVFVASGTVVAYPTFAMHRRADYYGPDPDVYRPERWEQLRPGWEYLPFNGGPRICLGQQYALSEAGYVTVRLLQEFGRMESRDPEPWIESLTLTLCSKNGTKVGLYPA